MNATRFDLLTRALTAARSRRAFLNGLAAPAASFVVPAPGSLAARKRRKRRTQRRRGPKPNAFGCLNVGQACNGNSGLCCSGICQGNKPKKGKRDRSTCVAHDTGDCSAGQQPSSCGAGDETGCTTSAGESGFCITTTGNAGFCARDIDCFPCRKDVDCQPFCGLLAACVTCADGCVEQGGTACAGPELSGCSANEVRAAAPSDPPERPA